MADHLTPDGAPTQDRARRPETAMPAATPDASATQDGAYELSGRPVAEVHRWLDGEGSEAEARRAEPRETAMWAKIQDESERRGRMTTPAPVLDRLMAAIPAEAPPEEGVVGKIKKLFGGK